MAWYKKEEDFDDSAAFETDSGGFMKIFIIIIAILILLIAFFAFLYIGYTAYNYNLNQTITNQSNFSEPPNQSSLDNPKITVNFTEFNITVNENPDGIYYYTTQERVVGEICYISNKRKPCADLTNEVCAEEDCRKNIETVVECYVNHKKIDCPK